MTLNDEIQPTFFYLYFFYVYRHVFLKKFFKFEKFFKNLSDLSNAGEDKLKFEKKLLDLEGFFIGVYLYTSQKFTYEMSGGI